MTATSDDVTKTLSLRTHALDRMAFLGHRRHDLRIGPQPGYVDENRSVNNTELFMCPGYGPDAVKQKLTRRIDKDEAVLDARRLNNTRARRLWRRTLLTFSHDAQVSLGDYWPDEEAMNVMQSFAFRHEIRLLSVIGHRDESAVHYHALFENISHSGRAVVFTSAQLSGEQDLAATHFEHLGIGRGQYKTKRIENGEPVSKTINRSVRQLHADLPNEIAIKQLELESLLDAIREETESLRLAEQKKNECTDSCDEISEHITSYMGTINDLVTASKALKDKEIELLDRESDMRTECEFLATERFKQLSVGEELDRFRLKLLDVEGRLIFEAKKIGLSPPQPEGLLSSPSPGG